MKIHTDVDDRLLLAVRELRLNGSSIEDAIALLRQRGITKTGSIRLLHLALGMDLHEAKRLVHASPTWKDRKESDEAFADSVIDSLPHLEKSTAA